ncbi:MAG: UbiA family prenyltransferase [Acidothermales bacterium]|nr:UbiA family prenyltransferase [Acidothermales bacterium]
MTLRGLLAACHPLPTAAVTAFTTAVAAAAGRGVTGTVVVGAAVLAGQLSVGWCNDAVDATRDRAVERTTKPVVAGLVGRRTVAVAAGVALAACVPLSLASGWPAGVVHLGGVLAAWAYDLGLKRTVWSWLPYAVGFGSLPAFVTLGLPGRPGPAAWAVAAAALLGVGAHLANVLPDLDDDRRTGVRGLPHRLGVRWTRALLAVPLVGASALVVLGPPGRPGGLEWAALGACAVLSVASAVVPALRRSWRRYAFLGAVAAAAAVVALFVLHAAALPT